MRLREGMHVDATIGAAAPAAPIVACRQLLNNGCEHGRYSSASIARRRTPRKMRAKCRNRL